MTDVLNIACDEAGHTGPDLLQKDQRIFAFASAAISDAEAFELISRARADYPVQMPELKAAKLLSSERGRKLIATLLRGVEGRYVISITEKLLGLCAWLFEYIYEPVYQDKARLLYRKNLHRFVAMYAWMWMNDPESDARRAISELQRYMRSRDPVDAPFLFNTPRPPLTEDGTEHPFESVLRFAYGYRDLITTDNADINSVMPGSGRWTLDLSASGLWSHLNYWGQRGKHLSVRCDASKPLEAIVNQFTGDDNDPGIRRARMFHTSEPLGWKLIEPIAFVDSRDHPAVQLADVIAGTAMALFAGRLPKGCDEIVDRIGRHGHDHSILPDMDIINPSNRSAAVNALILYGLAKRAERHADPYQGLEAMYHVAEVSWASGRYTLGD